MSVLKFTGEIPQLCSHIIAGKATPSISGKTFSNSNPANGSTLCEVASGAHDDVDAAVTAAQEALKQSRWALWPLSERAAVVSKLGDLILSHADKLALWETLDTGKPISESLNGDIPRAAKNCHVYAEYAMEWSRNQVWHGDSGSQHLETRGPVGIVGLITPWNLPLYLETWKAAPALLMGNAIILKPAELTPLTAWALGALALEAGVPPGILNVVQGFGANAAGEALVAHPAVKAISFTGETTTGIAISKAAAPHLKKLSFELGGKGASVIFADANMQEAIPTAVRAAFRNQGQICLAGSRILVEQSVYDSVVDDIAQQMLKIKVGDPIDPHTTMGALIGCEHRKKVQGYIDYAQEQGYRVMRGTVGTNINDAAYCPPTLIANVSQDSRLIQEEIFGPVVTIQSFTSRDDALAKLNGTAYGLSCSIWSQSQDTLRYMSANAEFGMVWLNTWFLRDLRSAFGGVKRSGIGREGGRYSLEFFSEPKTISWPNTTPDPFAKLFP